MVDGVVTRLFFRQLFIDSKDLIETRGSHRKECQNLGDCLCDQADLYIIVSVRLPATCLCTAVLDHDLMISFVLVKG